MNGYVRRNQKGLSKEIRMFMRVLALVLLLQSGVLMAIEHAPRVLSPHRADAYSMKTFAQYHKWKDLKDFKKVIAVYNYLADRETGIFPMGMGVIEGDDVHFEFQYIRDPVKMINVYTLGRCDYLGPTMEGVMWDGGFCEAARSVRLTRGTDHVFAEAKVKGQWCYLDLDLRAILIKPDGSLASTVEGMKGKSLWNKPKSPKFCPVDNPTNVHRGYSRSKVEYRHRANMGGSTMDYVLRRGETFTRWWKPQGDRWNNLAKYHKHRAFKAMLERPPLGPKCKHGSRYTIHNNGNGKFEYKPDLSSHSTDFADGVYDSRNVKPGANGLTLSEEGEGYAIFETRSPYIIVPSVGDYDSIEDDKEASVVKIKGEGFELQVSKDNGISWQDIAISGESVDLTRYIAHTYGYLLKINLKGKPGKAVINSLEVDTWVQLHPASLPALAKGSNKMQYVTGDHYGLKTRVLEIRTNGNKAEDFLKYLSQKPKDFKPERKTCRAIGEFVAKVQAPPGTKIAWFSAGGAFNTWQKGAAANIKNSMAYATGKPEGFKPFYSAKVPTYQSHWHYNVDKEVKLDEPAEVVYIKYVGNPGVNNLRIYAHCLEKKALPSAPMEITHAWKEGGVLKTKKVKLDGPGTYDVEVGKKTVDEYIIMSVPSSRK